MTVQEAQKIADNYCSKRSQFRKAIYGGIFDSGYLFRLSFQGTGHHGFPILIVVKHNNSINEIESGTKIFFKAWHSSIDYRTSSER